MPPRPDEGMSQQQFLLRLRAAIDTAINYPSHQNQATAINLAVRHPKALRSSHVTALLGNYRWKWLNEMGVYPVGEATEIAGETAIKGTYTPEFVKQP